MDMTYERWQCVEPLIGERPRRPDGRGRLWRSSCEVLNGILWILRTSAQWADLPKLYPSTVPNLPSPPPALRPRRYESATGTSACGRFITIIYRFVMVL